jgi:hypothetical protein
MTVACKLHRCETATARRNSPAGCEGKQRYLLCTSNRKICCGRNFREHVILHVHLACCNIKMVHNITPFNLAGNADGNHQANFLIQAQARCVAGRPSIATSSTSIPQIIIRKEACAHILLLYELHAKEATIRCVKAFCKVACSLSFVLGALS